jgi:hypothetical protein
MKGRAGRPPVDGLLQLRSPLRQLARPTATAFAGGRAILMELAHPAIAQTVAEFDPSIVTSAAEPRRHAIAINAGARSWCASCSATFGLAMPLVAVGL